MAKELEKIRIALMDQIMSDEDARRKRYQESVENKVRENDGDRRKMTDRVTGFHNDLLVEQNRQALR